MCRKAAAKPLSTNSYVILHPLSDMINAMNFTAIDFETATGYRNSICQVGLVRFENGQITQEINLLVQPPDNFYWQQMIDIHGINAFRTARSPNFQQIWPTIAPYIDQQNVVAHNGFSFDFSCLKKVLELYHLPEPNYTKHCTYRLYKANLHALCVQHNIQLRHHDALIDARACGQLFLKHLEKAVAPKG